MWKLLPLCAAAWLLALAAPAADKAPRKVKLEGVLRTGVVAIGGETTGTVLKTKKGDFELDLGKDKNLRAKAERLNGKKVVVAGTLRVRKGVEVTSRKEYMVKTPPPPASSSKK